MKKIFFFISIMIFFLVLFVNNSYAQTTLTQGDIAFIGLNSDGTTDDFSFILLKAIDAGTQINFTDCGWNDGTGFVVQSGDYGYFTWTAASSMSCGDIVRIVTDNGNTTPPTASVGSTSGSAMLLAIIGDQIFAFQGSFDATATFISAIHYNLNGTTTLNWDGACISNSTSALPDSLTNGIDAIWVYAPGPTENDNFIYNCTVISGDPATIRGAVNNVNNWSADTTTPFSQSPFPCSFTVTCVTCTEPTVPTITASPASVFSGGSSTITIAGTLNDATAWHVYTGSCGGTAVTTTASGSFIVNPTSSTTYYVRGEGACVTPGSCGAVTVTVLPTPVPEMSLNQGGTPIVDGGSQDFGNHALNSNTDLVFTITNSGTSNLTLTTPLTIGGADVSQFSVNAQPSSPVASGGGTTTFTIRFIPTTAGIKTANIAITNNDSDENPYNLTITGTGVAPEMSLSQGATPIADGGSQDFGNRALNSNTDLVFTITNSGTSNLTLTTPLTIGGADSSQFSVNAQPSSPVTSGGGTTTFTIRFTPTTPGTKTASIAIVNNDGDENPYNLTITGTGVAPEMSLSQGATPIADGGSQDFGNRALNSNTDLVFTITNSGTSNLTLTTPLTIGGTDSTQFSVSVQPSSLVASGGGTTTFTIRFTPTTTGTKTAAIVIANNDSDENPYNLMVTGTCVFSPIAITNAATGIGTTKAILNGTINANDQTTAVTFEYGLTMVYGTTLTATPGTINGTVNTSVTYTVTGLNLNTMYHYRVVGHNASGITSGSDMTFTTGGGLPEVQTTEITGINSNSAIGGGKVIYDGGMRVTSRGICWSTSLNPNISNPHTNNGSGTGSFSSTLTGLAEGTMYYVRAYAGNDAGVFYGANIIFTSLAFLPDIVITSPADAEILSGNVKITADSSVTADPVEFYINGILLGNGTASSLLDKMSGLINVNFNIDRSKYLYIDNENRLKKISLNGDIDDVFDKDLRVNDIGVNSIGEVFITFKNEVVLSGYEKSAYIKIDTLNKTAFGIKKPEIRDRQEPVMLKYDKLSGNYSIAESSEGEIYKKTGIKNIFKEKPDKVIKNTILPSYRLGAEISFSFKGQQANKNSGIFSKYSYTTVWNTLNHSDGIYNIKVNALDEYNREFIDEINVIIRNFRIDLNAARKEDRAYTFKVHFTELKFKIENPKNLPVVKYVVLRNASGAEFESIAVIEPSTLIDNSYTYYDKNIEKDISYTYKVIAYDGSGNILSESEAKTI